MRLCVDLHVPTNLLCPHWRVHVGSAKQHMSSSVVIEWLHIPSLGLCAFLFAVSTAGGAALPLPAWMSPFRFDLQCACTEYVDVDDGVIRVIFLGDCVFCMGSLVKFESHIHEAGRVKFKLLLSCIVLM